MTSRLPDGVYNTYRQYKHNCHLINRWVHQTILQIRSANLKPSPKPTKGRSNGANHLDNMSPRVTFKEFIGHVREVAASGTTIPRTYLDLLAVTIKQRKHTAAFYSSDVDAWKKNASHKKAIEVYMEALQILESATTKQSAHSEAYVDSMDNSSLGDAFSLTTAMHRLSLAFQDGTGQATNSPSDTQNDWIRDNPLINKSAGKSKGVRKPKVFPLEAYELVSDEGEHPSKSAVGSDALFALTCFLSDVSHLNTFCTSVWNSVEPQGKTSRLTASFTTNHAVQIVRQLEYDLVQDFPKYKDLKNTYNILNTISTTLNLPTLEARFSYQEQIMIRTFNSLSSYSEVLDVNNRPLMRDGFFGYFNPKQNRAEMTPVEKMREDQCLLFNYWPDLTIMHDRSLDPQGRFYGDYGLGRDFRAFSMCKSRPRVITWTLVFECQMLLSTIQARRQYLDLDLSAMRALSEKMCADLDGFLHDGVTYDTNKAVAEEVVTQARSQIHHWLGCDAMWDLKIKVGWDKLSKQSTQKDSLWRMNPWLTANAMTDAYMQFFLSGTAVMGMGGFIQSAMQLWNMLKQTGHLHLPERDSVVQSSSGKNHMLLLDHLIDIFGQKVFTGAPPKTADKFLKNFEIMLGVRAEAYAKGKREARKQSGREEAFRPHNAAGRGVTVTFSELWNMHADDYRTPKIPGDAPHDHPLSTTVKLVDSELGGQHGPLINLNLLKVHRLCIRFFTELHQAIGMDIERTSGTPYKAIFPTQIQWPMLTGWIARCGLGPDDTMLEKAGNVASRMLGDKEVGFYVLLEDGST